MKNNMFKKITLFALALIMVVGMLPATSASAEENKINAYPPLTFTEDGAATVNVYDGYVYNLDMEYLLKDFDLEQYYKKRSSGQLYIVFDPDGDETMHFIDKDGKAYGGLPVHMKYEWIDRNDDIQVSDIRLDWSLICEFDKESMSEYETISKNGNFAVKFNLNGAKSGETLSVTLKVCRDSYANEEYAKTVTFKLYEAPSEIKNVIINDFEFPGIHASAMDKDAWCDAGKMVSIRYLEEDMQTERTKLMAGDKGWVEFTVEAQGKSKFADGAIAQLNPYCYDDVAHFSHVCGRTEKVSNSLCKFYFAYEIADDEEYVIKKGTVNLIAPEAGAQASSKVGLSNVDFFIVRNMKHDKFTAEENAAIWLNLDRRGKWKTVTSFSALNIYQALVKLEPRGNYYFNADSVAAMKVPGAEKFTIQYIKSGALDGIVKEDGWYLLATFPVVQPKTFDLAIGYDKPDMTVTQNDRAFLTATSSCDLTKASDVSVQWYYSSDISKDPNGKLCGASDGDLKIQLETATVGTGYYKCVISCTVDGKTAVVSYPGGEWAKVTVKKASTPPPTEPTQKPTEPTQKPTEPTQKPTEPTTPPPTEPVSTDPVSTDPNPTEPVSTDPVSTDPEATTPDSQPTTDPSGSDSTGPNTAPSGTVPQPTTPAPTGSGGHGGTGSENGGSGILQLWWLWLLLLLLIAAAVTFCIMKKRNGNHQEGETT